MRENSVSKPDICGRGNAEGSSLPNCPSIYFCNRQKGHKGDHVMMVVYASWAQTSREEGNDE